MRKLQLLGDLVVWLVIVGVLSLGVGILALVGLLAIAREMIFERSDGTDSTSDERASGTGDVGRGSRRQYVMTP